MPAIIILLLVLAVAPLAAHAQATQFQRNWQPNDYRFRCGGEGGACILDAEDQGYVIDMLKRAVSDFRGTEFRTPTWWADRRTDLSTGAAYIELLDTGKNNAAFVSCVPDQGTGAIKKAVMNVGNKFEYLRDYGADNMTYSHLIHELFHLSQYEYPFWDPAKCYKFGGVPGWLSESTAEAVGIHMMIERYPSDWPAKRSESEVVGLAGLRRYDKTLPIRVYDEGGGEVLSGDPMFYRTHSFWRHIAEAHHGGKMDYLDEYMKRPQPSGGTWLSWLNANTVKYSGAELGMVFSGFLADYAGWGDSGHAGQFLGRKKWLTGAFGNCKTVYLSKAEPADYVEVDLQPVSGNCIEVVVPTMGPAGLTQDDSFAVQAAAVVMAGPPSGRGGIHLAMAASNDKRKFLCADEVKQRRKAGLGKCMFNPDDGKVRMNGGAIDARLWEVVAQQIGTDSRDGELKNLYTVSYTPTSISMRDTDYGPSDLLSVGLYFVLDVAKLEMDGQKKKGAVGSFGAGGADPQTTLPKRDAAGKPVNSYSKPDPFQAQLPVPPEAALPPEAEGKLSSILVGELAGGGVAAASSVLLLPAKENARGELDSHALSVGETGSFPLMISASINGEPASSLAGSELVVEEFTDLALRARYRGTLCRHRDLELSRPGQPVENPCRNPFPVSGEIVKAFAGSRLPGRYMVTERTEGTEMYRRANESSLAEWSMPTPGGSGSGSGESAPGAGSGSGAAIPDCACTCDERSEALRQAEELKAREAAGGDVSAGAIMGLMRCQQQCQSEYMLCVMEEDKARKAQEAAEQAAHQGKLKEECDCSCEALHAAQGRTEELLKAYGAGEAAALDELQSLGSCMGACQGAMMACAR
jgi:hypothetical protein